MMRAPRRACKAAVDAVAEEVGAVASARGLDALDEQAEQFFELLARQIAIRMRAPSTSNSVVFLPGFRGAGGDDLLHQDIEAAAAGSPADRAHPPAWPRTRARAPSDRRGWWRKAALRNRAAPVPGSAHALHARREMARGVLIWQTRSMVPISMPSSSDAVATSMRISPSFNCCSASRRSLRDSDP